MSAASSAPGPREKRFAAYLDGLAHAAGHADRETPLRDYCTGLLLPGERKSVEPLARRVRALHSYTVPEVVALPILGGNPDYLRWIDESVRPPAEGPSR